MLTDTVAPYYQSKDHDALRKEALIAAWRPAVAATAMPQPAPAPASAAVPSPAPPPSQGGRSLGDAAIELHELFDALCTELDEVADKNGVTAG